MIHEARLRFGGGGSGTTGRGRTGGSAIIIFFILSAFVLSPSPQECLSGGPGPRAPARGPGRMKKNPRAQAPGQGPRGHG